MIWDAVFFDFDGVIADSAEIKTEAFAKLFIDYGPDNVKKIVGYHKENEGISRYDKFRFFFKNVINKKINEEEIEKLGKEFSRIVLKKVIESDFINGSIETLSMLQKKQIPSYIVSGTPQDEIEYISKKKGIKKYFNEIHGSPKKKDEILIDVIKRHNYNPSKCIFIGDAISDFTAAKKIGLKFIGITKDGKKTPFPDGTNILTTVRIDKLFPSA